jgi:mono/diheme cytochrome c family protein
MAGRLGWSISAVTVAAVLAVGGYAMYSQSSAEAALLQPDMREVVSSGRKLYDTYCAVCHGANLEGQPNWRVRGADGLLPAPPHDASGHTWHHADELLVRITKFGNAALVGGGYRSNMPGFGKVLSDADIIAVLSYIKSTWTAEVRKKHDSINANAVKQ